MKNRLSWSYPIMVPYKVDNIYIEPTNHCNLRCIMCPHSKVRIKKGFMNYSLFKKIVDNVSSYNPNAGIQLFYAGESLLHPRILDMVRYLKQNNLKVHIATNATLLDKEMTYGLLDAGLDYISFSFDAPDKETYESIRIGANYESTLGNILGFLHIKEKGKVDMQAKMEIIEMKDTKDKIPTFIKKFSKLPVNIYVKPFLGWGVLWVKKWLLKTMAYRLVSVIDLGGC